MAEGAPRSFFTSLAGLVTGLAALISAGIAAYNIYKNEIRPQARGSEAPAEIALERFEAQPPEIAPGEALVLRWRAEHADTCSLEPAIGAVGVAGSRSVRPVEDTTYTLRCHGPGGETERSVSVSVVARAPERVVAPEPVYEPELEEPAPETRRVVRRSPLATLPDAPASDDADSESWQREALERLKRLAESLDDGDGGNVPDDDFAAPPVSSAPLAYHCCDLDGFQRCALVQPVLVGSGCFCPFQGTGISCP